MLICCQVDDLAIGCVNTNAVKDLVRVICAEDGIDLRDEGVLNSFNSVDVEQCDQYIKITCESDIDYAHYGWSSSGLRDTDEKPIEPVAASMTQQMFDDYSTAPRDGSTEYCDLETAAVFHTEVSWVRYFTPMLSLGRTSDMRSRHLHASPTIQQRCTTTPYAVSHCTYEWLKTGGLLYWRNSLLTSLPFGDFKPLAPDLSLPEFPQPQTSTELAGYVDAAHATDLVTRRLITGLVFIFCGGPLAYKSKIQSTVSTSSTEAEFLAAVHAAKIAKYLRSILSELGYPQLGPTTLFEDNAAAILMVNANRPTPRARHIDIQHFAVQERKAAKEIVLSHIHGVINTADSLTKSLGSTLHHRHVRRLMGHYGAP
jgi:hypothetical protein